MSAIVVGQLWADRDSREVAKGDRQRLRVVSISGGSNARVEFRDEITGRISFVALRRINRFNQVEETN